ncbi:3-mercaptopyruvate sulfurtransferase [Caulobacter sp. 73W]|uniref:Sulfurtransferase n=1 Tax=Caulobacter sp. 73W TaxID=3161137 RepID=A0AB39KS90_9CAUL
MSNDPLVSTAWLHERLSAPDVKVVDASWYMPAEARDPKREYAQAHIPGAVFFDIDTIADTASDLPHMLPSPTEFAASVGALGLGDGSTIVVYDGGGFRAARTWWAFRAMGHDKVFVLDGGLAKWTAEGRPVDDLTPAPQPQPFTPRLTADLIRDKDQVRDAVDTGSEQLVDARPAARFTGEAPEPRAGLRGGHMPGARSVPASAVIASDGTLLPTDKLKAVFENAGVDLTRPIVTTCGSGVTASILALALHRLGLLDVAVYDGSWTEWGGLPDAPVVTGPA